MKGYAEYSPYAAKPWLSRLPAWIPSEREVEDSNALVLLREAVEANPESEAIRYFQTSLSYGELDALSDAFAGWLESQGVVHGDRVFVILQNVPQFTIAALGAWKVGAVPVLGNPMYTQAELTFLFADCRPSVAVCHTAHSDAVRGAAGPSVQVVTTSPWAFGNPDGMRLDPDRDAVSSPLTFEDILSSKQMPRTVTLSGCDTALLLYTSGTTGKPKGVLIRHSSVVFNTLVSRDWFEMSEKTVIFAMAPFFHITGFVLHMCLAFAAKGSCVMIHRFEANAALEAFKSFRPTFTVGASTAFIALMNLPQASHDHMRSFTHVYSGGAPIPPSLVDAFEEKLGVRIHSSFGMTETCAPTHLAPPGSSIPVDPTSGALSIGIPISNVEAAIIDEQGQETPVGEPGELVVRSPGVMVSYWDRPEDTAATLAGGWMHTGDVGFMDAEGWFYLVDRKKDVIIASGFKVWPREVEDVILQHPAVSQVAVVGVPDSYRGETPKAFVVLKPGYSATKAELLSHTRERLAAYKQPKQLDILASLPTTATGKISRQLLREQAAQSQTTKA